MSYTNEELLHNTQYCQHPKLCLHYILSLCKGASLHRLPAQPVHTPEPPIGIEGPVAHILRNSQTHSGSTTPPFYHQRVPQLQIHDPLSHIRVLPDVCGVVADGG